MAAVNLRSFNAMAALALVAAVVTYGLVFAASFALAVSIEHISWLPLPPFVGPIESNYVLISQSMSDAAAGQFVFLRIAAIPLSILVVLFAGRHLRTPAVRLSGRFGRGFLIFASIACALMSLAMMNVVFLSPDALNIAGARSLDAQGSTGAMVEYWFVYALCLPWMILATGATSLAALGFSGIGGVDD